ncbi:MAG: RNA-binding cell elongation regulator Jag/EloR [Acidimicrobiales bacterium]
MEWVETTGRTVEEAKKSALEQLGVAENEAEFEIISEPKIGLFGRLKEEARVRARIQPRYPRPKGDRRDRRRGRPHASHETPPRAPGGETEDNSSDLDQHGAGPGTRATGENGEGAPGRADRGGSAARRRRPRPTKPAGDSGPQESTSFDQVTTSSIEEQVRLAEGFLQGLLSELGAQATITSNALSDEVVELRIEGEGLGTLIGPKGATLLALQELTRTVLQRQTPPTDCRLVIDVNGYRRRRQEALARFAQQVAAEVKATNVKRALEPMPPSDRKVVHDAVNAVQGVGTISEGEEPYRRVVLVPLSAETPSEVASVAAAADAAMAGEETPSS